MQRFLTSFTAILNMAFFVFFTGCMKPETHAGNRSKDTKVTAVVLFAVGDVTVNNEKATVGSIVGDNDTIKLGKRSTCDLQMRSTLSSIAVRLTEKTTFHFDARSIGDIQGLTLSLDQGAVLSKIEKLSQKEEIQVITPSSVAAVRGTKFSVSVDDRGNARTTVFEGKVAARPRIESVETLPPEVLEQSKALSGMMETLGEMEIVLEQGNEILITETAGNQVLERRPELREKLKDVHKEIAAKPVTDESAARFARNLDEVTIREDKDLESLKSDIRSDNSIKITPEQIPDPEIKVKLEEYNELILLQGEQIKEDSQVALAVQQRNNENRKELTKRIEKIFDKKSETLILKNGKRINGVIYQVGEDYSVLTVDGKVDIKGKAVEGFAF